MRNVKRSSSFLAIGGKVAGLVVAGAVLGACTFGVLPGSGRDAAGASLAAKPMTGTTLSSLHASIGGDVKDGEIPATF